MKDDQPLTQHLILTQEARRIFQEANVLRTFEDASRIFEIAYESKGEFHDLTLFLAMEDAFNFMLETGPEIFRRMFHGGLSSMLKAFLQGFSQYEELVAMAYHPNEILEILLSNPESEFLLKLGTIVGYPPSKHFLPGQDCYGELAQYSGDNQQLGQ